MGERVVITGLGVVSGAGRGKDAFFKSCSDGASGIRKCTLFPTDGLTTEFFGEVTGDLPPLAVKPTGESRVRALMRIALEETLRDSGLDSATIGGYGPDAWLCFGTLVAIIDGIASWAAGEGELEHVNDYLSWLRALSGVKGGTWVSSAACAAGTTAAGMAFEFIRNGLCRLCVVGGADPLTTAAAVGFHTLKSLSGGVCNPWDEARDGINIGEGAAFFIFEELESARARGAHLYGEVLGCGLANDAYHITAPDPEGVAVVHAMREAIREAGVSPEDVDHINGHGTGTVANDQMEINAINALFGPAKKPCVTSTKAITGHCMGASGAIELAALLLAIENQVYMPLPNLGRPIDAGGKLDSRPRACEIRYALSNSFAFAGNIASILVGRVAE
ncbi:MAG: beta-ketoacyl-[acyl-carrier-protein] synthase family protein [Synergistaceae bacterium]|jgi:3-oxoacyl-[acyl-carrier-protein] synthase II|nr:beta-ketoacyl-[acyl-carrier-protein] synthase family protein [Synergistaceae bacterium]